METLNETHEQLTLFEELGETAVRELVLCEVPEDGWKWEEVDG